MSEKLIEPTCDEPTCDELTAAANHVLEVCENERYHPQLREMALRVGSLAKHYLASQSASEETLQQRFERVEAEYVALAAHMENRSQIVQAATAVECFQKQTTEAERQQEPVAEKSLGQIAYESWQTPAVSFFPWEDNCHEIGTQSWDRSAAAVRAQQQDDAMPVDEEWLKSIGFGVCTHWGTLGMDNDRGETLGIDIHHDNTQIEWRRNANRDAAPIARPTRGDIRRLLAAIRSPLE